MKRPDAFRKLRTICQRLDELDPNTFQVEPRLLYLYGSVLTDRPNPDDVDLVLVFEYTPDCNFRQMVSDMIYGKPAFEVRVVTHLRKGMKMIQMATSRTSLANWEQCHLFLVTRPRLIWRPGANWAAALDEIESFPLPWSGPRAADSKEQLDAYIASLPEEELQNRLAQVLAEIEGQELK